MTTPDLLSCPFCGAEPESNMYFAWCTGPDDEPHGLVQLGLDNWNCRFPVDEELRDYITGQDPDTCSGGVYNRYLRARLYKGETDDNS